MKKIGIMLLWLACGFYGWGTTMAELNWRDAHEWADLHESPRNNVAVSAFIAVLGPAGATAIAGITLFNEHGWTLYD